MFKNVRFKAIFEKIKNWPAFRYFPWGSRVALSLDKKINQAPKAFHKCQFCHLYNSVTKSMWIFPRLNNTEYRHIQDSWKNLIKNWLNPVYSKSLLVLSDRSQTKGIFSNLLPSVNSKLVCTSSNKPGQCYPKVLWKGHQWIQI